MMPVLVPDAPVSMTTDIMMQSGPRSIVAIVFGQWLAHPAPWFHRLESWTVTHGPSGLSICGFGGIAEEEAIELAWRLHCVLPDRFEQAELNDARTLTMKTIRDMVVSREAFE